MDSVRKAGDAERAAGAGGRAPTEPPILLQEHAYISLRDAIIKGELKPGERVYESALAERLGISRSPVREAVRRLQHDGLFDVRPRRGIYVTPISLEEFEDVYRIRASLEAVAARFAAERRTEQELKHMELALEKTPSADTADQLQVVEHAQAFHALILEAARSPRLSSLLAQIHFRVSQFRTLSLRGPGRRVRAAQEHAHLFEAIREGDPDKAEAEMRLHIESASSALLEQISSFDNEESN